MARLFIDHNFPKITRVSGQTSRLYTTPSGKQYPSVTTVVSLETRAAINQWRQNVGDTVANQITTRASKRGTAIHGLCEQYLLSGVAEPSIFDHEMFNSLIPELDQISAIHCLETQMYSDTLEVAGTVDCIGQYRDYGLCVIDFKTSKKYKSIDSINHYFMQTAAYSQMFYEHTGIKIDKCCVIIGVDDRDSPLVYCVDPTEPLNQFKQIRDRYRAIHHL